MIGGRHSFLLFAKSPLLIFIAAFIWYLWYLFLDFSKHYLLYTEQCR